MKLSINQKLNLKTTIQISLAGIMLALAFIFFEYGLTTIHPYVSGAIVGLISGITISYFELYLFMGSLRKLKFIRLLSLKSLLYLIALTTIILNVVIFSRFIRFNISYLDVINDPDFKDYIINGTFKLELIYTLSFALVINFTRMMGKKMGQNILFNYITGKYYKPVLEARIILFVQIQNSSQILDKLQPLKFHNFLRKYYLDLTKPAISSSGIIHEYVEELLVISWPINKGLYNGNCIKTIFDIKKTIQDKEEGYLKKYGIKPKIQAGLHVGSVVTSEIGEIKTQIVFSGDTMNTTSRILGKCADLNLEVLASEVLIMMLGKQKNYNLESIGNYELKGKQEKVSLFEINQKTLSHV